jgi:hypothetical protein
MALTQITNVKERGHGPSLPTSIGTRPPALDHERAKSELKALVPEDAREASGHGLKAKRSKSGATQVSLQPAKSF